MKERVLPNSHPPDNNWDKDTGGWQPNGADANIINSGACQLVLGRKKVTRIAIVKICICTTSSFRFFSTVAKFVTVFLWVGMIIMWYNIFYE
ncbi:MAG: hypothetical protein WCJ74_01980 [bacterium]